MKIPADCTAWRGQ